MHKPALCWSGVFCCFILFILVFLSLQLHVMESFIAAGHLELGLLFFIFPGAMASFLSKDGMVVRPLMGAMLASPLCLLLLHLFLPQSRSFWQEVAWLLSAVFWSALGSLCFLLYHQYRIKKRRR